MPYRQVISGVLAGALIVLLSGCIRGCPSDTPPEPTPGPPPPVAAPTGAPDRVRYVDVTKEAGIEFLHRNGASGERYFPETMVGGLMAFDYDNDGDLDLYFSQAGKLPHEPDQAERNVLYRNEGGWRFTDVSKASGLDDNGYGNGATAADVDSDGDLDVYVSNFGKDRFYRNKGDGTFEDATEEAGFGNPLWSIAAAFADYDRDGHVDLYVANYLDFTVATHKRCGKEEFGWVYCHPDEYAGVDDILYRNKGDGSFEDVTRTALPGPLVANAPDDRWLSGPMDGKAMGVIWTDCDLDGNPDIYVTNDSTPNYLFRNLGDGTFDHETTAGVAYNEDGLSEASMGVDAGDMNGDGWMDLFTPDLNAETFTLYLNHRDGTFSDYTTRAGIAGVTADYVGYSPNIFDFDNDGDQDIFVTNGHTIDNIHLYQPGATYAQHDFLFENDGEANLREVGKQTGDYFSKPNVGRSSVVGDIDNDGDIDIAILCLNERPYLLRNEGGNRKHFILLKLIGTESNRDAIGALVKLTAGGKTQVDELRSGCAYQGQSDLRMHFGLGSATKVEKVVVQWPHKSGKTTVLEDLPADHLITIVEGKGVTDRKPLRGP